MERVVLPPALEADFHGFRNPLEVCDAQGKHVGLFLPLETYKKLLANLEIPYSKEELERRRQEKGGVSLPDLSAPEPTAVDPRTNETYILVRREVYERLKSLRSLDDYDPDEGATYVNEIMAEDDANDPLLDSYQKYRRKE